jgi:hypothetical protein
VFGLVAAWQLIAPDLGRDVAWLGWGRVRYAHTQGIMLGWLANAFFAFLYHAVPILTGRPVTSARLGVWIFALWNFAVMAPGWVLVLAGVSQPLEWAEFPLVVDVVAILALALAAVQFLPVSSAAASGALRLELVHHRRPRVHAAGLPDGQHRARVRGGRQRGRVQRPVDSRRGGLFVTMALAILYFVIPPRPSGPCSATSCRCWASGCCSSSIR